MHGGDAIKAILSPWPVERPVDWTDRVNAPLSAKEFGGVRVSIERGRPFGPNNAGGFSSPSRLSAIPKSISRVLIPRESGGLLPYLYIFFFFFFFFLKIFFFFFFFFFKKKRIEMLNNSLVRKQEFF